MTSSKRIPLLHTSMVSFIGASLLFAAVDTSLSAEPANSPQLSTAAFEPVSLEADNATVKLSVVGSYRGGMYSSNTPATPPGYDPLSKRLFVGSGDRGAVDVIDIRNPYAPEKLFGIGLGEYGGEPTSVAVSDGIVAVTVVDPNNANQAAVLLLLDADGGSLAGPIDLPGGDRMTFTPDKRKIVIVATGAPNDYTPASVDPEGVVVVVELGKPSWRGCQKGVSHCDLHPKVTIVDFHKFNDQRDELVAAGVRIYGPGATVAQDLEPEGFAITPDSRFAWLSLERNNAFAVVDLERAEVVDILPLGTKDHSLEGNWFAASDRNETIKIQSWPVRSFYSPDGTAIIGHGRNTYIVTANEGDPRDFDVYTEKARLRSLELDPEQFPDALALKDNNNLGRLQVTTVEGDIDGDGDYDEIYMLGSRSFSVWAPDGNLVFDSGDEFEQITAQAVPNFFNTTEDANDLNERSDDRGPEPEHLTVGRIGPRTYAFIGFERIGGIIAYDVTNPRKPRFEQYINNRNFSVDPSSVCGERGGPASPDCFQAGDLEPEGMVFIPKNESPIHTPLLAVIHEASDSTTLYRIDQLR